MNVLYFLSLCIIGTRKSMTAERHSIGIEEVTYTDGNILIADNVKQLPTDEKAYRPDMCIAMLCNKGRFQIDINGKKYTASAGDLLLCNSFHTLTDALQSMDFSCSIYGISMNHSHNVLHINEKVLQDFFFANEYPVIHLSEEQQQLFSIYKTLIDKKVENYKTPSDVTRYDQQSLNGIYKALFYDLLSIIDKIKSEIQQAGQDNFVSSSVKKDKIRRFLLFLAEDDSRHHTVEYFASLLCVTPKYLCVLCKQETGKTPSRWIREQLIEKIRYYLLNTSLTAKEICHLIDMPNASFFGKYVKQHFGCTPMEYRNKNIREKITLYNMRKDVHDDKGVGKERSPRD